MTPSHAGYTFTPANQTVTINGANISGVNFTATAQTFSISGNVSPAANGSGSTITLSGAASAGTTADASGNYSFTGLANGAYVVTPSKIGFTFTPPSANVTISGANQTGINFTIATQVQHSATLTWVASTSTVSGYNVYRGTITGGPYVKLNSSLITVLTYVDTNVQSGATYYYVATAVDSSGTESVNSNEVKAVIP